MIEKNQSSTHCLGNNNKYQVGRSRVSKNIPARRGGLLGSRNGSCKPQSESIFKRFIERKQAGGAREKLKQSVISHVIVIYVRGPGG